MTQEAVHNPMGEPNAARTMFGASTAPWARMRHDVDEHSWLALSGSGKPDYNLGLVHGGDPAARVAEMLDQIRSAAVPSIVMLAGAGLAGGQVLADAGWVCLGALPFMAGHAPDVSPEPDIRLLQHDDLVDARTLAASAFGIGEEVAGLVFCDRVLERPDTVMAGLMVDGRLVSVAVLCRAEGVSTGWGLATVPDRQRAGYASRVVAGTQSIDFAQRGPSLQLCLATPQGRPLYDSLGMHVVEYWQTWSRPRWVLGGA